MEGAPIAGAQIACTIAVAVERAPSGCESLRGDVDHTERRGLDEF